MLTEQSLSPQEVSSGRVHGDAGKMLKSIKTPTTRLVLQPNQNIVTSRRWRKRVCIQANPQVPIGSQFHLPPRRIANKPSIGMRRTRIASVFICAPTNVTDHAGGARDSTTCEDLAAASRASDCYDFPLPTGDDAPCHVADGCPAGGCSFLRRHHDTRWPRPGPVADVIHPDVGRRIEPFSPWPAAIQLALLPDRLPRFIQTPVDAAYGCFGSSSPSRLTFDTRPVRPAAMPPFVALREDVRFRPRRRAFDFPRGDRVWIVTHGINRRGVDVPLRQPLAARLHPVVTILRAPLAAARRATRPPVGPADGLGQGPSGLRSRRLQARQRKTT
jgi:hypothetical protein